MKVVLDSRAEENFTLSRTAYKFLGLKWDGTGMAYRCDRTNLSLVNCVSVLGDKASGGEARLIVADVPTHTAIDINSYIFDNVRQEYEDNDEEVPDIELGFPDPKDIVNTESNEIEEVVINTINSGIKLSRDAHLFLNIQWWGIDSMHDISYYGIDRNDPGLIECIKELGDRANGPDTHCKIVKIPKGSVCFVESQGEYLKVVNKNQITEVR